MEEEVGQMSERYKKNEAERGAGIWLREMAVSLENVKRVQTQ